MLFARVALHTLCLAGALVFASVPGDCAEPGRPANQQIGPRVRALTPISQDLLTQGVRRSRTFRRIVDELEKSDIVVYLEVSKTLPAGLDGRLTFMTAAGGVRYLYAQVSSTQSFEELIAAAGHELQHAVEVAAHAAVRDAQSLAMLYERIGIRNAVNRYDTAAARIVGQRVRAELG
jgi:predicted transcriptional regulator